MKLVRIGNVIFNMEQLLAVKEDGEQMFLYFVGSSEERVLVVKLEKENYYLMQSWLNRNGVNDLSKENPEFDWF